MLTEETKRKQVLMFKKIPIVLLFILLQFNVNSQKLFPLDSLKKALLTLSDDTNKIFTYILIGQQFENNNIDSALYYYQKAGSLSKQKKSLIGELKYISNYTAALNILGKYDQSLALNFKSLILSQKNKLKHFEAISLSNIAVSYQLKDNVFKSLDYYLKAITLFEKNNSNTYLGLIYSNVCGLYLTINEQDEALKYALKGIQLNTKMNDLNGLCGAYINIGNVYKEKKIYDKSLEAQQKAYLLANKLNNNSYKANACINIANVYLAINKNSEALLDKYNEAYNLYKSLNDPYGIAISLRGIGITYFNQKKCEEAKKFVFQALNYAKDNQIQSEIRKGNLLMSDIELCLGNMSEYDNFRTAYDSINDLLKSENASRNAQELEVKYETIKKQKLLVEKNLALNAVFAKTKQKDQLLIASVIGILLLIGILFLAIRFYFQKRKLNEKTIIALQAEQENVKLKSHLEGQEFERMRISREMHDEIGSGLTSMLFLSHTLQTSQNENQVNQTAERIGKLSNDLSNQMNEIIWSMNQEYNTLQDLISYIRQQISELIENANFDYQFNFPEIIPEIVLTGLQRRSLYLVIKESVNNALKYSGGSKIIISCKIDDEITFTIKDNGKGIPASEIKQFGNGLRNMQQRMKEIGGKFIIQSKEGTAVSFVFPCFTKK
jgi:signal transduction histidine kinase